MNKATETAAKMIESLPESAQDRVVEELRALVEDARDEAKWDELIVRKKTVWSPPPVRREKKSPQARLLKWISTSCEIQNVAELLGRVPDTSRRRQKGCYD